MWIVPEVYVYLMSILTTLRERKTFEQEGSKDGSTGERTEGRKEARKEGQSKEETKKGRKEQQRAADIAAAPLCKLGRGLIQVD
jgi:hypothetical protein